MNTNLQGNIYNGRTFTGSGNYERVRDYHNHELEENYDLDHNYGIDNNYDLDDNYDLDHNYNNCLNANDDDDDNYDDDDDNAHLPHQRDKDGRIILVRGNPYRPGSGTLTLTNP